MCLTAVAPFPADIWFLGSIFYLLMFMLTLTMKAWFRAVTAAFQSEATL
jgi:hypothetical protein